MSVLDAENPTEGDPTVGDAALLQAGDRVIVASRLISRTQLLVGEVVRSGSQLHIGDLLLHDDLTGPNRYVRILAHKPGAVLPLPGPHDFD